MKGLVGKHQGSSGGRGGDRGGERGQEFCGSLWKEWARQGQWDEEGLVGVVWAD